jgi:signal transduction histidine kinase/ABC-type nitrate/sulfonate/bicarbonate transport system substrate-binding protein
LQLHWKYQFEFAGFIAAKEKGFYRDVGLDVELKEYEYGRDIVKSVLNGESNYGVYNSNIFLEYLNKKKIKLLSSYFKRSALVLITKPNIKTPKDLVGKVVMSSGVDDFKLNFQSTFDNFDVNISDLKLVKHTYNVKDFSRVDAMTAFISDQPYKLDKLGIEYNIINPSDLGLFNLQLELFTSNDEIKNHPKRTKAFRDASLRGWNYALKHKDEIINIIYSKYSKNISLDDLLHEASEVEKLILPNTYSIGSIDRNFLNRQIEMFKFYHQISDEIGINDFIYENRDDKKVHLTREEIEYLADFKNLKVCLSSNILPFDSIVDNKHIGIMNDIFDIISHRIDKDFKVLKFTDARELEKNIKENRCQLISNMLTNEVEFYNITPSKPFYKTNYTLVSSVDKSFVSEIDTLKDKKLVVNSYIDKAQLLKLYPYLHIVVKRDKSAMVKMIMKNRVYGAVVINETADYLIDKFGYGKLKINGFFDKNRVVDLSIGINSKELMLVNIINKALATIPPNEINNIVNKWRITRYNEKIDYKLIAYILYGVFLVLAIMVYYQRKLKHFNINLEEQVAEKTAELRNLNASLELAVKDKVEELIKKDKILTVQSKQAVMGEMISMIAHQWRQPLSMITLQISNMQVNRLLGKKISDEDIDKALEEISNKIVYLADTIDDFQTYFRPDRVASEINMREFIDRAISLSEARIKTSKISLTIECNFNGDIKIYTNELIQVVLNILNNAVDSFADIQRDKKIVKIVCDLVDDYVEISIIDNGSGIKDENIKSLFDPYFSTKGKNGTGLGLYMSQMIIQKQFNGKIEVDSSSSGTRFKIVIPKKLD